MIKWLLNNIRVFLHDIILRHKVVGKIVSLDYPYVHQSVYCMTCDIVLIDLTYKDGLENYY